MTVTEPPHHGSYGPWVHHHPYAYHAHWRAYRCGRTKGRLLWFALGAGAAALYFRGKPHPRDSEVPRPHGVNGYAYTHPPINSAAGTNAGVAAGQEQAQATPYEDRPPPWGRRDERPANLNRPPTPIATSQHQASTSASADELDKNKGKHVWKWDHETVRGATGAVRILNGSRSQHYSIIHSSLILNIPPNMFECVPAGR